MTESSAAFDAFAAGSGGYFDLQVNGFGGVDFQRSPSLSDVRGACEQLLLCRMTRILATFITCDAAVLREKLRRFEDYRRQDALIRNTIVGYHLEGPYLNSEPGYRGAHRGDLMKDPDWDEFQRNQEAADGRIRLVTLAPERKSAAEFIREASAGACGFHWDILMHQAPRLMRRLTLGRRFARTLAMVVLQKCIDMIISFKGCSRGTS